MRVVQDAQPLSRQARRTLLVLFVATIVFTVGDGSATVLLAPYLDMRGITQLVIGQIAAAYSVAALAFRFVTGSLYRPRRTVWLVPGGCVLQAVAFFLTALTGDPLLLTLLVGLNGAGQALASTGGLAAIMDVTDGRNAGSIMGWYTGCIGAGYAISGFLGGWLGDAVGLVDALKVLAAIPLVAGLGLTAGLRRIVDPETAPGAKTQRGRPKARPSFLAGFRHAGPMVWLAATVGLQINLVSGVLNTFFPLYGLAIGLSLTQIGVLNGVHSGTSSVVRFLTPPLFRRVSHRSTLPWMVLLSGAALVGLTASTAMAALTLAWLLIGLSRGFLRVSSAALVTEAVRGPSRGAASGIYLAGLDVGKIIGPIAGGLAVEALGYETTFVLTGLIVPVVYFGLSGMIARRSRPPVPVSEP